jgi:hypothetical protein
MCLHQLRCDQLVHWLLARHSHIHVKLHQTQISEVFSSLCGPLSVYDVLLTRVFVSLFIVSRNLSVSNAGECLLVTLGCDERADVIAASTIRLM